MNRFSSLSASYFAVLAAGTILSTPFDARAGSFTVPTGTTQTGQQTVSGTDTGHIEAGGTLGVTGSGVTGNAIIWNGAATGPAGISIVNDGTITSSGSRAIDTSGTISGPFTLQNNGSIQSADDTFRINNAFQNGNLHVVNVGSMTSNTGQVFDLNSATAATASVLIENSGSITASKNDAIRFGAGTITLINSGTIEGQGGNRALSFDTKANVETLKSFTLVNQLGGKILGTNDAFKISAGSNNQSSAVISIGNYGLIDGGGGQALDFADLTSPNNVITITNYGTGIIQSQTADAMRPGAGASVINYGIIRSTDMTSDGDGVDFQGAGGSVVNETGGQILGAKHGITGDGAVTVTNEAGGLIVGGNGSGINIDSSGSTLVTVTNYGTIRGEVTDFLDEDGDGVPDGDGDGVDVDGKIAIDNYGLIQGTGATGTKDGVLNTADGIAAGGGLIHNHVGGVIEAYDNYLNDGVDNVGRAILIDDSAQGAAPFATTLMNEGTIRSDGVAVTFIGANDDIIDNAGLIHSGNAKAVDMGDGDDLFIYRSGSQMDGYVTGNGGSDTFELGGVGSFNLGLLGDGKQYRDFETLRVGAGSSFTAAGTSSFAGDVALNGSLILNGSLSSAAVNVGDGGVLGGNATLGTLTVGAGGTVAPGNSIGTITVDGTATFNSGSTYAVQIDANSSDQLVAGTSAINGGTVVLSALGPITLGKTYTIVSASQTTTPGGQFDSLVAPDFLFIKDPTLAYDGGSVALELESNGVSFASFARTANQAAVAEALDAAGGGAAFSTLAAAAAGEEDAVATAYDLLSGEVHASLGNTLYNQSTLVADTLVGRLRQASAATSPASAALAFDGPVLAYGPTSPTGSFPMEMPGAGPARPIYTAWAQGFGQWSNADGNGDAAKIDGSVGGLLAGVDLTMGNAIFGIAGGYASADSNVDARLSSADASTILLAAYAGASLGDFRLRAGASQGWSDIDTRRTVGMLGEQPAGSYDGSTTNLFVEAAYAAEAGGMAFEPFAQAAWSRIETDSFSETNAPASGLTSSGLSMDVPYSTFGLRLANSFVVGVGVLTPHATLAWRHAYDDVTPELAMSFLQTGNSFTVAGAPIARDSFLLSAGLDFNISQDLSLNIDYEGQLASDASTNAVKGGLTYRF